MTNQIQQTLENDFSLSIPLPILEVIFLYLDLDNDPNLKTPLQRARYLTIDVNNRFVKCRPFIVDSPKIIPFHLAKELYDRYQDRFICSSLKHHDWWVYLVAEHRWFRTDYGRALRELYQTEIWPDIALYFQWLRTTKQTAILSKCTQLSGQGTFFLDQVMKEASCLFYDQHFESRKDDNKHLIGFTDGVYDLRTKTFQSGRPKDCITLSTGLMMEQYLESNPTISTLDQIIQETEKIYLPAITSLIGEYCQPPPPGCEKVQKLMAQWFPSYTLRENVLDYLTLQLLIPSHAFECITFFYGSGANGKTVFQELLRNTFGDYVCHLPVSLLSNSRYQDCPDLTGCQGARLVFMEETHQQQDLNLTHLVKLSYDDSIICRPIGRDPLEYKPHFQIFMTLNNFIDRVFSVENSSFWRRATPIPFESRFTNHPNSDIHQSEFPQIPHLAEQMAELGPAFFYLLTKRIDRVRVRTTSDSSDFYGCTWVFHFRNELIQRIFPPRRGKINIRGEINRKI